MISVILAVLLLVKSRADVHKFCVSNPAETLMSHSSDLRHFAWGLQLVTAHITMQARLGYTMPLAIPCTLAHVPHEKQALYWFCNLRLWC